ncbi:putative multiple-sugar transport system permease YteP [Paenibacillus konkukensis]|uniref:Multiple-sugar transport system permease YteP n=1 Tax=Paenibacillus konkukensis TaxID=2020716 RepID=A0ABY4RW20_9BACL|nr:ABC transporter permease subunit [Paenibacillus konkukensis]UQZ86312.1 putative multiple-sugar transport system permease YteP [Paenibacillus konkukensis]
MHHTAVMRESKRNRTRLLFRHNWNELRKHKYYFVLLLPGLLYFLLFHYWPMAGVAIAFKDFRLLDGMMGSPWAGLKWFRILLDSPDFWISLKNTAVISLYKLLFNFPAPVVLALLLNEVYRAAFKRVVQTIVYFPHFLSWVILGGILVSLFSNNTGVTAMIGLATSPLMDPAKFRGLLVLTEMWKEIGWGTIIYLAAISGINPELYEAARMDGANRYQLIRHITIPSIASTIVIMLILRTGQILHVGFDQIYVLYNPLVFDVADVLDTYVYRVGITMGRYSFATAAGLFQSLVGLLLLLLTNSAAKKMGERGIW